MKITLIESDYIKDEKLNKEKTLNFGGKVAGICYSQDGFKTLENEQEEKTNKRIKQTLNSGHHSVFGHTHISLNIENIPKILAMVLNNEKEYNTSEKSARYTKVENKTNSIITREEENLYNKWQTIFENEISYQYGNVFNNSKIKKLTQENSRYLITVFMPTNMIYTTSFRQINYIIAWMNDYIKSHNKNSDFESILACSMINFIKQLQNLNIIQKELLVNQNSRKLSLFSENINDKREDFGDTYSTIYKGSFAQLAQAQRHRTLNYEMGLLKENEYFIPPIINHNKTLVLEWLKDIHSLKNIYPQGQLINIYENGTFDNFILKCKERLCTHAQLEIMQQTRNTLLKYQMILEQKNHPLKHKIEPYTKGAKCTFPNYTCLEKCNFTEGKKLIRKI